jgi:DNA-binding response OmpR family regulator
MARILVAEDDPDIRHLLTQLLIDEGHEVAGVGNGAVAMTKMMENPPDLLVLDLMMPALDGFQVLEALRDAGLESSIRIIVLSARTTEHDFARTLGLGACRHMTKPFDPDEFLKAITELLALTPEELRETRDAERDRANILSQLESIFSDD